jgi:NAD(P)-dependent dehydrogenase (short-subunit alcohol dehydrogenase family)
MPCALITGCDEGIGRGFANAYLADGWEVIATHRDIANRLPESAGLTQYKLDVTQSVDFTAVKSALAGRPIDVLVSNAGIAHDPMRLGELDFDFGARMLDTNVLGPLRLVEAFRENVAASSQRKIAMITSRMGSIGANISGGHYVYRASKAGLNALSRSLAVDLFRDGILVTMLHPGGVRTRGGTPDSPLSIEESVDGMRNVISRLGLHDTGQFYSYTAMPLPW